MEGLLSLRPTSSISLKKDMFRLETMMKRDLVHCSLCPYSPTAFLLCDFEEDNTYQENFYRATIEKPTEYIFGQYSFS